MSEPKADKRRKYPRIKVPKGMFVGWKSPGHHTVSRMQELGLGGVFVYTTEPETKGSTIELLFDVPTGEVRARAIVRHVKPSVGMGLQFVQMQPEDRARLNRYLISQQATPVAAPDTESGRSAAQPSARTPGPAPASAADVAPSTPASAPAETAPPPDEPAFEQELKRLLELAEDGTYYRLLGVTTDCTAGQVKKSFYSIARKFHPDHHMEQPELVKTLQHLMEVVTRAYKTLGDAEKRAAYDKKLAASGAFNLNRETTEARETLQECFARATEYLRARNFVGSVTWLRKCVELAPGDAKYRAALARSLGTVERYRNEAIQHFETAVELDPWNVKIHFQYAELCEEMQLFTRARDLYSKILVIDPTHAKGLERLAELDSRGKDKSSTFSRMFSRKA
ncbi:MAG: DnaJ domain-containing protein [Candidatus Acidiferrales bacterium]|jgi:Flp pilus assembly protein TadD